MSIEYGGKTVFGASVGIMMLETRFPRIHGDIANAWTWPFPVHFKIVRGASPHRVVRQRAEGLLDGFIEAGRDLVFHGADALTTNCGYLSLIQNSVKEAVGVPVATSSLMQVAYANSLLPSDKRTGIITISKEHLTPDHLDAAGVPPNTPIVGTEGGREFARKILDDLPEMDFELCRQDLREAASELMSNHDGIGAIVLECTNMVPYAADVRKITGVPVYSIYTLVCWLQSGLIPRSFPHQLDDPVHPGGWMHG